MMLLLLKGISWEISGFNEEILIYLLESCAFFIIFKFLSSSTIYNNYYFFMTATFRPEILYTVYYVPENNVSRTLAQFLFSEMIYIIYKQL